MGRERKGPDSVSSITEIGPFSIFPGSLDKKEGKFQEISEKRYQQTLNFSIKGALT